jgi:hypothetical protein
MWSDGRHFEPQPSCKRRTGDESRRCYQRPVIEPVVRKRVLTKLLDFLSMAVLGALSQFAVDFPALGVAVGAAYILCADRLGLSWKSSFGLEVVDATTEQRITLRQCVMRNVLWVVSSGARVVIMAMPLDTDTAVRLRRLTAFVGLGILISFSVDLARTGRHMGDRAANTVVRAKGAKRYAGSMSNDDNPFAAPRGDRPAPAEPTASLPDIPAAASVDAGPAGPVAEAASRESMRGAS